MDELIAEQQAVEKGDQEPRRCGSCTPQRSQYSTTAMTTDWSSNTKELMDIINVAFYGSRPETLNMTWRYQAKKLQGHYLLAQYVVSLNGVKAFLGHTLISVLSLLGVCPLKTYSCALIAEDWKNGSGTVKLIAACVPKEERNLRTPKQCMGEVRKDVNAIFNNEAFSFGYSENLGCEGWRTFCAKLKFTGIKIKNMKKGH